MQASPLMRATEYLEQVAAGRDPFEAPSATPLEALSDADRMGELAEQHPIGRPTPTGR